MQGVLALVSALLSDTDTDTAGTTDEHTPKRSSTAHPDGGEVMARSPDPPDEPSPRSEELSPTLDVHTELLLDHINTGIFVIDGEGDVIYWNDAVERMTGSSREEAREADQVGTVWYQDGRRAQTLAEKVLAAPHDTATQHDVTRVSDVSYPLYEDTSTFTNADGETRHITFSAAPLIEGDEVKGVVELIEDRTADRRKRQQLEALVAELQDTMAAIEGGDLSVRAEIDRTEYLDDSTEALVDSFNQMIDRLEGLTTNIANRTDELEETTDEISRSSEEIAQIATEQADSVESVGDEVAQMSATIEEIASTAEEVANAADESREISTDMEQKSEDAQEVLSDAANAVDEVTTDVESLQADIEQIDTIVEVIDDIAEETNILALNASIEAARADSGGEGFAVVAEEIKGLAEESQNRATEIETTVQEVQKSTNESIADLRDMQQQVNNGIEQVQSVMDDLHVLVTQIEETAEGMEQVSDATDDQAARTEEVASMADEVVDQAHEVSTQIDRIADASTEQAEQFERIETAIAWLSSDTSETTR